MLEKNKLLSLLPLFSDKTILEFVSSLKNILKVKVFVESLELTCAMDIDFY